MSDPVSALEGIEFNGAISISDAGPRGMVTLRGDFSDEALRNVVSEVSGANFPEANKGTCDGERGVYWMSPDELLVTVPYGDADAVVATITAALDGAHHLVVNVSDARTVFRLSGEGGAIRDALAKLTPADVRPSALPPLTMRRTRLAQVPAAIFFQRNDYAEVICFRSVSTYAFGLLKAAAASGSEVGHF